MAHLWCSVGYYRLGDVVLPFTGRQGEQPGTCLNAGRPVFAGKGMVWWMSKGLKLSRPVLDMGAVPWVS